jgi:hypothetical protein
MSDKPKMGQPGYVEPAKLWDFLREMYHAAQWPKPSEQVASDSLTSDYLNGFKDGVDYAEVKVSTATERLVRGQVADRLSAILYPTGPRPASLEDALEGVRHLTLRAASLERRATASEERALVARDAALEEAATKLGCVGHCAAGAICSGCAAAKMVRALKSKPAPIPEGTMRDLEALGATREQVLTHVSPEPLHDFGWALQQMRAGKKVRLHQWPSGSHLEFQPKCHALAYFDGTTFSGWVSTSEPMLATDWEVVE